MTDIIKMIDQTGNASNWGTVDMLEEAQEWAEENREEYRKGMVMFLDDNGHYSVRWFQAGMKASEMVALLEVAKSTVLEDMGY